MTEKRLLALIALLIGLIGGLLILNEALRGVRLTSLDNVLSSLVFVILGVAILLAGLLIYRGKYAAGGVLSIVLGVVALILAVNSAGSILAIVAGVVGLIASETRP